MQSNGQFSSCGRFTLGKDPQYPLDKELGGSMSWTGHGVEMKKNLMWDLKDVEVRFLL